MAYLQRTVRLSMVVARRVKINLRVACRPKSLGTSSALGAYMSANLAMVFSLMVLGFKGCSPLPKKGFQ